MTSIGGVLHNGTLSLNTAPGLAQASVRRAKYQRAQPFPHIVIDNFLSPEIAGLLSDNFPPPSLASVSRVSRHQYLKRGYRPSSLGAHPSAALLRAFNSRPVIDLMEALTGHKNLVADPDFVGGGFHETARGGRLDVHADFNLHPRMGLIRRINLIIFLNREWDENWGGALELWSPDMSACSSSIMPAYNRAVVFDTGKTCFHGHPDPLKLPKGLTRRSVALYYYSAQTPADRDFDAVTDWKSRPGERRWVGRWTARAGRAWRNIRR